MILKKTLFDLLLALIGIIFLFPFFIIIAIVIKITSKESIIFCQKRIGRHGKLFTIYKFRTMYVNDGKNTISVRGDSRITPIGRFLRKYKLDELPELTNIIKGDMSFVGPRPDVPGYADKLIEDARRMLELKPGITGPATLKYANEEEILASVEDPIKYNDEIIFPDKVKINIEYLDNWSLWKDIKIIFATIFRTNY
jgi:lipopolysaccharide/colanic/teichoic acid biosynthesis glycosyltransferase